MVDFSRGNWVVSLSGFDLRASDRMFDQRALLYDGVDDVQDFMVGPSGLAGCPDLCKPFDLSGCDPPLLDPICSYHM